MLHPVYVSEVTNDFKNLFLFLGDRQGGVARYRKEHLTNCCGTIRNNKKGPKPIHFVPLKIIEDFKMKTSFRM
jgi:hypothetical protein